MDLLLSYALNKRAILVENATSRFDARDVFLRFRIVRERFAVLLVSSEIGETNQSKGEVGLSRNLCRKVISNQVAAGASDWCGLAPCVLLKVFHFVLIDGVTNA